MKKFMIVIMLVVAVPVFGQDHDDWSQQLHFRGVNENVSLQNPYDAYDAFLSFNIGLIVSNQLDKTMDWYQADLIAMTAGFAFAYKDVLSYQQKEGLIPYGKGIRHTSLKSAALGIVTNRLSTLLWNGFVHDNWSLER